MGFLIFYALMLIALPVIRLKFVDRDLLRERAYQSKQHPERIAGCLMLAHWGLAGFDLLLGLSAIPMGVRLAAAIVFLAGSALNTWAMIENRFFSSVVRHQWDRGQSVIQSGPYRFIRHPGNLGGILAYLASGMVLGSWLAIIPALWGSARMVKRIAGEDELLKAKLAGYEGYASRVRWRLLPGCY